MNFGVNKIIPPKHRCSKWNQILTPLRKHSPLVPWYDFEFADDYYTKRLLRRSTSCQLCLQTDVSISYPNIIVPGISEPPSTCSEVWRSFYSIFVLICLEQKDGKLKSGVPQLRFLPVKTEALWSATFYHSTKRIIPNPFHPTKWFLWHSLHVQTHFHIRVCRGTCKTCLCADI
jgi:hypothetical protein